MIPSLLTAEQIQELDVQRKGVEEQIKSLQVELLEEGSKQQAHRKLMADKFAEVKAVDENDRTILENMKTAQFARGAEIDELTKYLKYLQLEPIKAAVELTTMEGDAGGHRRRGHFPLDEIASKSNLDAGAVKEAPMHEVIGTWLGKLGVDHRFFRNDGTGTQAIKARITFGDAREHLQKDDPALYNRMLQADAQSVQDDVRAAVKSGFTTNPNNPGWPFGGNEGNLGLLCGWQYEPLNCGLPFPDTCFVDSATRVTRPNAEVILFDRQLKFANRFAPVAESIINSATGAYTVAGKKPLVDYGWATLAIPLVTIAGIYTVSERALKKCSSIMERVKETATKEFRERVAIQALTGTGAGGATPQLRGLLNQPDMTVHTYRDTPFGASTDQIPDAVLQALTALTIKGCKADTLIINPADALKPKTAKDTQGRPVYLMPCQSTNELFCVPTVCEDPYLAAGTIFVGKFKNNVYIYDDGSIGFAMGYINDDFQHNIVRMRWEQALALLICRPECVVRTNSVV